MATYELNKDWQLELDPTNPQDFRVHRLDGKFFEVRFDSSKWGQPVLREVPGADGYTGAVIPIVRTVNGVREVAVADCDRVCNGYTAKQIEGTRYSASNPATASIPADSVRELQGFNHINSARIADKTRLAVAVVDDVPDFQLPAGSRWLTFGQFFATSTDSMTKAVLGQYLVETLGLS
jgi:hypothetical protein